MTYRICVLSTWEEVLSSICYMPYWVYAALEGRDVELYEEVTYRAFGELVDTWAAGDVILLDVSTAPQVELAKALVARYRPYWDLRGIGYGPFIAQAGLPAFTSFPLERGVFTYPLYSDRWQYGCATTDSHIVTDDPHLFYPIFTSIGCRRNCGYCYVPTAYYPRAILDKAGISRLLDWAKEQGHYLHFEDENFLRHPDAHWIIQETARRGLRWIMLTDSLTFSSWLKTWGPAFFQDHGLWLAEIGLETVDPLELHKRQDMDAILASSLPVFWLAMTFLPGETVASLRHAGEFYRQHGMPWERLVPRLRTQSSLGGLGQFFQPYPGTPFGDHLQQYGKAVGLIPTRLRPSFVPYTFLREKPQTSRLLVEEDRRWISLYGRQEVAEHLLAACDGQVTVEQMTNLDQEALALLAVLARLGCLHENLVPTY